MSRHSTARRHARPAASDDDKFVHGVLESSAWARENSRLLVISGIVVVALIAGFLLFRNFSSAKEAGATSALNDLRATVGAGNVQLALRDGQALLAQYGGTEAADEARLLMGQLHLQAGQADEAVNVLAPIAGDVDGPLGFNAAMLLGAAQEASGETAAAIGTYEQVGRAARFEFQQVAGYEEAARLQTAAGDVAAATATYDRVLDLIGEASPQRGMYELRRAELATGGAPPNAAVPAVPTAASAPSATAPAAIAPAAADDTTAGADTTGA